MDFEIKRLSHNIYDVFFGQGWSDWSRVVYKKGTRELIVIKGRKLNSDEVKNVVNYIVKGN